MFWKNLHTLFYTLEKTENGEYISSYECDPETVDKEFDLSKSKYKQITGRSREDDIIAYQIRQAFKPGEVTPEEANKIGYETAIRWTKGNHAFICGGDKSFA